MCILAIQYKKTENAPILLAANREEYYERPSYPPRIQSGKPRVICGIDRKSGGTWFGVNQHGLVVTVVNRPLRFTPDEPRSRGLLCRDLLGTASAEQAVECALRELKTGCYPGALFLCADSKSAAVVHREKEIFAEQLSPGLHVLTKEGLNARHDQRQEFVRRQLTLQKLNSAVTFLAVASRAFSRPCDGEGRHGTVIHEGEFGTVSSILLSLTGRVQNSILQYAPGSPADINYDDYSALMRQVLSTGKEKARKKQRRLEDDYIDDDLLDELAPDDEDDEPVAFVPEESDADDDLDGEFPLER